MIEDLPTDRCQGDRAEIGRGTVFTLLENPLHMGMLPCCGDLTRLDGFVEKSSKR